MSSFYSSTPVSVEPYPLSSTSVSYKGANLVLFSNDYREVISRYRWKRSVVVEGFRYRFDDSLLLLRVSESVLFWYDLESKSDCELVRQKLSDSLQSKICYSRTDRPSKDIRRRVQAVDNDNLTDFNM